MLRLLPLLLFALLAACSTVRDAPHAPTAKRIALSFDDVPRLPGAFLTPEQRTDRLIAGLDKAGVEQAAFFVTVGDLNEPHGAGGAERIARYVQAGHVIANHSFAHRPPSSVTAEGYLADIDRAEAWLADRPGHRAWFRFPFLNEGGEDKTKRDSIRAGLEARGLRNGYATIDASDWNMEALTLEAVKEGKRIDMDALRDLYVETHVEAAEFYDRLARRTLGRSPAHVLMLHETDLAALFVPDLVQALRRAGWTIIGVDAAYADPIGAAVPDVPSAQGTLTEALAWEKGLPAPRWYERNNKNVADALFRERVLGQSESR